MTSASQKNPPANSKNIGTNPSTKILDESPEFVETSLSRFVRFEMRKLSPERTTQDLKVAGKMLCPAGQKT